MPGYTMQKQQLQTRLRRIEGQVRGVARMIDEDKYCVDVVTQVAAIQAALDKVSLGLLDGHIRGCVREEIRSGGGEDKVDELLEVMDLVPRERVDDPVDRDRSVFGVRHRRLAVGG